MSKKKDIIEKWTKKIRGIAFYYYHRKSSNGEIIFSARYKSRSGRSKAIKRLLSKEDFLIRAA